MGGHKINNRARVEETQKTSRQSRPTPSGNLAVSVSHRGLTKEPGLVAEGGGGYVYMYIVHILFVFMTRN